MKGLKATKLQEINSNGSIIVSEIKKNFDFLSQRFFFVKGKKNDIRGNHAHKNQKQFMVCITGSVILKFNDIEIIKMTDLPRVVAESDVGSIAMVEVWRKNKKIIIEVELGELPEQTYVKAKSSKNENKPKEEVIKSLGITIKDNDQSEGVTVTKVDNEEINLDSGDIIIEVNREAVKSIKSFTSLVEKYEETGRSSLLLKIQRGEETSWVTIKFVDS